MNLQTRDAYQLRGMMKGLCVALLFFHFYYYCYGIFTTYHYTFKILDNFVANFEKSGLFKYSFTTKIAVIVFWAISLVITDRYSEQPNRNPAQSKICFAAGVLIYFGSGWIIREDQYSIVDAMYYLALSLVGFILVLIGVSYFAAKLTFLFSQSVFNEENETFPQEERLIQNPYSVNLPARYKLRNQYRNSHINVINCFRATAVWGSAGSGKTLFVIRHFIAQWLEHQFCLYVYDFKFDDLTRIAYNYLQKYGHLFERKPSFFVIDFDHLNQSNRCNPLDPASMHDLSDAAEASRTILLSLNKEFVQKQGDFFVESAISFITANMWFLRKFEDGRYCTLPHLIELIQYDYAKLFSVLRSYPEIETLISPFVSAFLNDTMDTLESQAASARIALASLSSPKLYYVLSGNEFTLDVNNPNDPKVVCMGSNPEKQQTYGAVLSLYITRMIKLINKKDQLPCGLVLDELSTVWFPGLSNLLATARSNKVAVIYGAQSLSLMRATYGRNHADVLFDLPGNLFCGQTNHDTAKAVSEGMGRILQRKNAVSYNSRDNTISTSEHLDAAVPASKITGLSSGEFVGFVADNPDQKIKLKKFHCEITVDVDAIKKEEAAYLPLPEVRQITDQDVQANFLLIKEQVKKMMQRQLSFMQSSPELSAKIVVKNEGGRSFRN